MFFLGLYDNIGNAWIAILKKIFEDGIIVETLEEKYIEFKGISVDIAVNNDDDPIIEKYGDSSIISWMKSNFEDFQTVKELGHARSYASRLYSYNETKNQISWIIEKIQKKPMTRSATITTFEPLTDEHYIPCISLLDFDKNGDELDMYVYARALDFGGKAYANLICLKKILSDVARELECNSGSIHLICKSVHIYDCSCKKMKQIIEQEGI